MRLLVVQGCRQCSGRNRLPQPASSPAILLASSSRSSSRSSRGAAAGAAAAHQQARRGLGTRAQRVAAPEEEGEEEPAAAANEAAGEMLKRVVASRHSAKAFDAARGEVPEAALAAVLAMTLRCPTSFNVQPFTVTVVQSREGRQRLAACMLGPNKARVLQAPVTAVFAADLDPVKLVPRVQAMERARGLPEAYLSTLPFSVAFLAGQGHLAHAFKDLFTTAMSPLQPMPSVSSLEAWSYKNTAIAASWYMLAAAAHGLDTCPMEGFDGRRIQQALRIPAPRYAVPLVIATGYAKLEDRAKAAEKGGKGRSPRFPPETVVFRECFGKGWNGIPVL